MAIFSLRETDFEVPTTGILLFGWAGLEDSEIRSQLCFQQQFLSFFRYVIENLQSRSQEHPNWPARPLSLSLRAGALKAYIQCAVSIIEGALAELGAKRGLENREVLHRKTFGALLDLWKDSQELTPMWQELQLLKTYRNFVHLGNAAANKDAYWKDILERESDLLNACDKAISWLSRKCDDLSDHVTQIVIQTPTSSPS